MTDIPDSFGDEPGDEPGDEWDQLAAEYVLGTLDGRARADVERRAAGDTALAALIADWQSRLAPLTLLAPPAAPPADLWRRIERATAPTPRPASRPFWATLGFWRGATGVGFALAAALAIILVMRPPVSTEAVATLIPVAGGAPVFLAEATSGGTLRLRPLGPVTIPTGRDLELWSLAAGATRPISLGVLPTTGRTIALPILPPRTQLLVTIEPTGGSPSGLPTGPVLYGGTLTKID